jgi:hypothetical protein
MFTQDDDLKARAISFMEDGSETEAAALLERCDIFTDGDLFFYLDSDKSIIGLEVEIRASRTDLRSADLHKGRLRKQVETAIESLNTSDQAVHRISWTAKAGVQRAVIAEKLTARLDDLNSQQVKRAWQNALRRLETDPRGAITSAKATLEGVCKRVLRERGVSLKDRTDLPALFKLAAREVALLQDGRPEGLYGRAMQGCVTAVENLAAIRNRDGDAHVGTDSKFEPQEHHAELLVNMAGSVALFLVAALKNRAEGSKHPTQSSGTTPAPRSSVPGSQPEG